MAPSASPCRPRTSANALVGVVLLAFALLPGRAEAGCGDHLRPLNTGQAPTQADRPASPQRPCSGPECQQAPAQPAAPVPVTAPVLSDEACLGADRPVPPLLARRLVSAEQLVPPCHHSLAIFHPPR